MVIYDISQTAAQLTDEKINVANSNPVRLVHDLFYNKTGKKVVIRTGAGGTGTLLTESTDYTISGTYTGTNPDPTWPVGDIIYQTISVTNATYHNVTLYVSYYPIGDLKNAAKHNNDVLATFLSANDNYEITSRNANLVLTFTHATTNKTITLPDPTLSEVKGQKIHIRFIGTNTGTIALSRNINGVAFPAVKGTGNLFIMSNGTEWITYQESLFDSYSGVSAYVGQKIYKYTNRQQIIDYVAAVSIVSGDNQKPFTFVESFNTIIPVVTFSPIAIGVTGGNNQPFPTADWNVTGFTWRKSDATVNTAITLGWTAKGLW